MINYNDLYEVLRKEKYGEALQMLPNNFILDVAEYLESQKEQSSSEDRIFADSSAKSKKQLENFIALFRELILRRKRKLLNLVFVAAETGIMKRDYDNMLAFEKEIFEKLAKAFEDGEKSLRDMLQGTKSKAVDLKKMILFTQNVEQFIDMSGKIIGPFNSGELANLDSEVSNILVSSGKAHFVDAE